MMKQDKLSITVALTGQPNVGKSTVFNMLTGMNQHVGNWSGKTVEKKTGTVCSNGNTYNVVDLPGTYSLTANSPEEAISRDFIINERPDVVVAILNAAALERNLYLVAELLPLKTPLIVVLNMMDVAEKEGHRISPGALEKAIGVRVVSMVASKRKGLPELMQAIDEVAHKGDNLSCDPPEIRHEYLAALKDITGRIDGHLPGHYSKDWIALKLLEGDVMVKEMIKENLGPAGWGPVDDVLREHKDAMLKVAGDRYAWIEDVCKKAVKRPGEKQMSVTARWDRFATHPVYGVFIMLGILAVGMIFTKRIGLKVTWDFMDVHLPALKAAAASWLTNAPPWVASMVVDGLISGVGILLIFVVFLTMFYAVLGFLEDVGYLSRVGFMMHRFMSKIGLHGKSCMPLCVGFACNIPGVIGTRVVETERARLMTILLTPFIPCIAQLTVAVLLAPIFFGSDAAPFVVVGLVLFNIVVLGLSGKLLNRLLPNRESLRFIMELPLYHWPNPRTIAIFVWQHMKHFVEKAGTVIVAATILIWALSYFPHGDMDTSILSSIGKFLTPLGELLGLNWQLMVALFASFLSKESTLVSLGVLVEDPNFVTGLQAMLTPAAGLGFLVVNMLFIPCITTFAVIVTETRSWKWSLLCVGYLFVVAFGMGILVYQVAGLII
ncbi:MAG: ferrous iron transport protein B [Thermodesulfobacteriota bacterium]|nr:ferrous iron transport protein B [Thermodesulfobacteriota bacterium]